MTLADRIVVMNDGRIEQIGTPMELFNNPVNTFVAGFLGSPPMNQVKGTLTHTGVKVGNTEIKIDGASATQVGRQVVVGLRPEHVTLSVKENTSAIPIVLDLVEPLGSEALLHGRFEGNEVVFKAETNGDIGHLSGVTEIHVASSLVKLFDGETGQALNLGS
jgi:multiple sugar transport system ATP-binding protein